jgi:curved DNA-binding protein CbpA
MFIDYYSILEISHIATKAEVKSSFKKQAIRWHPDKNLGHETTHKMQVVNEAFLILNDDEARNRYDREYLRFKSIQQEKERARKGAENKQWQYEHKKQEQEKKNEEKNREQKSEKRNEEYSTFQFDDDVLKKWVENARKQASRNVNEMVVEFRDSSVIGFGTFFGTALKAIGVSIIFLILFLIISLLIK